MKTFAVLAVVVAVTAANPFNPLGGIGRSLAADSGQFVLTQDYSLEDGHEYSMKYVKSYTPGKALPIFHPGMGSSEEIHYNLASQQGGTAESWTDRVKKLRHLLNTGVDASDELYNMYFKGASRLPADRQYYVDSSGEIYYDPNHQNLLTSV